MDGFSQLRFTGNFVDQGLARGPYIGGGVDMTEIEVGDTFSQWIH